MLQLTPYMCHALVWGSKICRGELLDVIFLWDVFQLHITVKMNKTVVYMNRVDLN